MLLLALHALQRPPRLLAPRRALALASRGGAAPGALCRGEAASLSSGAEAASLSSGGEAAPLSSGGEAASLPSGGETASFPREGGAASLPSEGEAASFPREGEAASLSSGGEAPSLSSGGEAADPLVGLEGLPPPASWAAAAALSLEEPSADDLRVISERHVMHPLSGVAGVGRRCKFGVPQAFAMDPFNRHGRRSSPIDSGLFRLSCPRLVKAIDELEARGAVRSLTAEVAAQPALAEHLDAAHAAHAAARLTLAGEERVRQLLAKEPEESEQGVRARTILKSGIAGQQRSKLDVKCLHAVVADYLCRSGTNKIGAMVLERLEARSVHTCGDLLCFNQCNMKHSTDKAMTGWYYMSNKNRAKLRNRLIGRQLMNERRRAQQSVDNSLPNP